MSKEDRRDFSTKLNDFYCRFERHDLGGELAEVMSELCGRLGEGEDFVVDGDTVQSVFMRLNVRKAAGPGGIWGQLLKLCASQLSGLFSKPFSWTFRERPVVVCTFSLEKFNHLSCTKKQKSQFPQ